MRIGIPSLAFDAVGNIFFELGGKTTMRTPTTFLILMILCIASLAVGQTVFTDDSFFDADWTTTIFTLNNPTGVSSSAHEAVGGNPDDHRSISTNATCADWDIFGCKAMVIEMRVGAIYDPATSGEIHYLSYGEDQMCAPADNCVGGGQAWYPAIMQDGKYFIYVSGVPTGVLENWTTAQLSLIDAAEFGEVALAQFAVHDLSSNPDFSTSGAPIQFGYARANSISATRTGRIDNWTFGVNTEVVGTVGVSWGEIKSVYR